MIAITMVIAFVLGGSPDWHKHVRAGAELLHVHLHFGAHEHPHAPRSAADDRDEPEGEPPGEPIEGSEYVSFAGSGFEATAADVGCTATLHLEVASSPCALAAPHRWGVRPRSGRGPPAAIG